MENMYPSEEVREAVDAEILGLLEWDEDYSKIDFFVDALNDAQKLDREDGHIEQDRILLQIIRSYVSESDFNRIAQAYNSFKKWYA